MQVSGPYYRVLEECDAWPGRAWSGCLADPDFQGQAGGCGEVHQRVEGELAELAAQQVVEARPGDRKPCRRRFLREVP